MSSQRKHLQEIYGEGDNDSRSSDFNVDFNVIIDQLKEKYGNDWHKHIDDYVDDVSGD